MECVNYGRRSPMETEKKKNEQEHCRLFNKELYSVLVQVLDLKVRSDIIIIIHNAISISSDHLFPAFTICAVSRGLIS